MKTTLKIFLSFLIACGILLSTLSPGMAYADEAGAAPSWAAISHVSPTSKNPVPRKIELSWDTLSFALSARQADGEDAAEAPGKPIQELVIAVSSDSQRMPVADLANPGQIEELLSLVGSVAEGGLLPASLADASLRADVTSLWNKYLQGEGLYGVAPLEQTTLVYDVPGGQLCLNPSSDGLFTISFTFVHM